MGKYCKYLTSISILCYSFFIHADTVKEHYFIDHIQQSYNRLIAQNDLDRSEQEITYNLPFAMKADETVTYRGKFLLIHGLNDSPYVWHDAAKSLSARGFDVRAILLPDHGSSPKQMLDTRFSDWLDLAREHLVEWQHDDTPIYLGGFSLGGVLATILALEQDNIEGLLLVSPAYHSTLNDKLRWAWLYKRFEPWLFGTMLIEDNPVKYNSIAINSAQQYYKATEYLKRKIRGRTITIPTLMVISDNDSVVDTDYVRRVFRTHFANPDNQLIIYSDNTDSQLSPQEISRDSAFPKSRILNQSHLSLINHSDNPLYGKTRKVLICNGNEYSIFMACMNATNHWYGAQHTPSPDGTPVARVTYNPDYDYVWQRFDQIFHISNPQLIAH